MRKRLVMAWLAFLFLLVMGLFWRNAWVYSLPTPIPQNYHPVTPGTRIPLTWNGHNTNKPVFLHFFNPDCPCSRFNIAQFKTLVHQYGQQADFAIVVLSPKKFTQQQIQEKFNLNIPVFSDSSLAVRCGVYSTPQAVIIDPGQHLFYRGNYNKSRYCTDEKTSFAGRALDSLLHHHLHPAFSPLALRAYGCQLPVCTN